MSKQPPTFADLVKTFKEQNDPLVLQDLHHRILKRLDKISEASDRALGGSLLPLTFADPIDEQVTVSLLLMMMTSEEHHVQQFPEARMMFTEILREVVRDTPKAFEILVNRRVPIILLRKVKKNENEKNKRDDREPALPQDPGSESPGANF